MRVISLFSGAGGLDLGLVHRGHRVVWANDNDKDCVATYRHNIGRHIELADIASVEMDTIPDADAVVGGFPCQGFSRANLLRSKDDPRNHLYRQFARIVREKQPRFFVAENVRGILSLDEGRTIQLILKDLSSLGYRVDYQLVNAADYGVPQLRRRVLIFGTRGDVPTSATLRHLEPTHAREGAGGLARWTTMKDALCGLPRVDGSTPLALNHVYSRYKVEARDFTGHRLTDWAKPSPTILARGNGGGGVCALPHPGGRRRLSVRESARIQTFPDDFEFLGALNSMYRQVGNAVPVLLAERLGDELARAHRASSRAA